MSAFIIPGIIAFAAIFCAVGGIVAFIFAFLRGDLKSAFKQKANPSTFYNKGIKAYEKGNYSDAQEFFEKTLEASPSASIKKDAKFMLGSVHYMQGSYSKAQSCFEELIKSGEKDFDINFNYALTLQKRLKYADALKYYFEAMKLDSQNPDCYLNMGKINYEIKSWENAFDCLTLAQKLNPENTDISLWLNKTKEELCAFNDDESLKEIIESYEKMIEEGQAPEGTLEQYARALARAGMLEKLSEVCTKALTTHEHNPEFYKLSGLTELIWKRPQNALGLFKKALKLNSSDAEIYNLIAYAHLDSENTLDYEKNKKIFEEMVSK